MALSGFSAGTRAAENAPPCWGGAVLAKAILAVSSRTVKRP